MTDKTSHRPLAGLAFAALAMALMSGQDAILKWLTAGYATMQILFIRGIVVAGITGVVLATEGGATQLRTQRPWGHAIRCVLNLMTIVLFIFAIARLPLGDVMAIVMASPLFTLAFSVLILGDHVGVRRWLACGVGFLGVLIMFRPGSSAFSIGGAAALGASVSYSLMMIQTRRLTTTESNGTLMFYIAATVLVVSGVLAPFQWRTPSTDDVLLMVAAGFAGGIGHFCFVQAYRFARPAVLAPIDYTALIWGVLLGWLIWNDLPDLPTTTGALLVVASGLYIVRREAVLARAAAAG